MRLIQPSAKLLVGSPQAIIRWPKGLSSDAVIYLLGGTDTETEEIQVLLASLLSKRGDGAESRG